MRREIEIVGTKVKVNLEFDFTQDSPDILYWLKEILIEKYRKPRILTDDEVGAILGVTGQTIKNWRYKRKITLQRGARTIKRESLQPDSLIVHTKF